MRDAFDDEPELDPRQAADTSGQHGGEDYRPKRRFRPIRFKDVRLGSRPACIVHRLLPRGGLIVVWGSPKCGKSFWISDLGMHVALGWDYRGRRVAPGTVVYIACEGESGQAARAEAFRQEKLAEDDNDPPFYLLPTRLDLVADITDLIADIRAALNSDSCALIVVDTLNRSIAGSESKDEDMTAYVRATDALRESFGCAVVLIHHCGVDGTRPRGHTSLTAAADAQIAIKRGSNGEITAIVEYMKDGPEGEEITSRLVPVEVGTDEDGGLITSCIVVPVDAPTTAARAKARPHLSNKNQIALDTLRKALAVDGKPAPPHNHIPPHATVTSIDLWRRFYLAGTSADEQSANTRRVALHRSCEALQAAKLIGICDEMVWEI